ncbi:16349_t:CDS:2, partial [Dentiscutata erythropus]
MSTLRYIILFFIILSLLNVALAIRCGPNFKNAKCPGDTCCSRKGVCGTGAHCGRGCQPNFGRCNTFVKTHTKPCVTKTNKPTPSISVDSLCGPNHGNATCRNNLCCSKSGHCGSTSKYCKSGCQSSFGRCDSSNLKSS